MKGEGPLPMQSLESLSSFHPVAVSQSTETSGHMHKASIRRQGDDRERSWKEQGELCTGGIARPEGSKHPILLPPGRLEGHRRTIS